MKTTPNVSASATSNAKPQTGKFSITPGEPVAMSDLLKQAKQETGESTPDADEPKPYPVQPEAPASTPDQPAAPVQVAPEPQPEATPAAPATPVRSRSEEIEYQIAKSGKLQLINTQLQSLKSKQSELKQFSFAVDKDEDYRYGRLVIYDDNNREFQCKNHGLAALIVEHLKALFEQKVDEKESELLTVSRS